MVHESGTVFANSFFRLIMYKSKSNADRNEQQSMVKHHIQPKFDILWQVCEFVAQR